MKGEDNAARFLYFTKIDLAVCGGGDSAPLDALPADIPTPALPHQGGGRENSRKTSVCIDELLPVRCLIGSPR